MKSFEEYVEEGIVCVISPDPNRAAYMQQEAKRKYQLLLKNKKALGINDENANDYVEYCYNIVLFFLRAQMFLGGYNTVGKGDHSAEVAYSLKVGFTEPQREFLDELRYFRNGILYYGKRFDAVYAKKVIAFTKRVVKDIFTE